MKIIAKSPHSWQKIIIQGNHYIIFNYFYHDVITLNNNLLHNIVHYYTNFRHTSEIPIITLNETKNILISIHVTLCQENYQIYIETQVASSANPCKTAHYKGLVSLGSWMAFRQK